MDYEGLSLKTRININMISISALCPTDISYIVVARVKREFNIGKRDCASDIPGQCKGISGAHLRVSGAFQLIYFTFLICGVGGLQEV